MKTHKQYLYTTKTFRKNRWYKPGQTDREVAQRIDEQDTTAFPEPLIQLGEQEVPLHITDIKIRDWLAENKNWTRTRMDKLREWRQVPADQDAIETWQAAIHALQFGVARPYAYSMRDEQKDCLNKAVAYFRKGGDKFLINAKMRFGKTFTAYHIAKKLGYKRILVITYKPDVKDGWCEDLEKHVDFEGWRYFYAGNFDSSNPIRIPNNGPVVLFTSFQDFNVMEKAKWEIAERYNYDLVIIDEQHYGSDTDLAKESLARIRHTRELHVSGTPLDALMSGKFLDEQIYTWGYADEQAKRREEQKKGWRTEVYRPLPPMMLHTFEVCDEAKKMLTAYNPDEGFSMTKMLASDDGVTLNDKASAKLFFDQVLGIGVHKNKSPYRIHAANHSLWSLPRSVKSVNATANLLRKYYGDDIYFINVAGDNEKNLKRVKELIKHYPKTITLTCGRFTTGVTVPEWDMVLMLDDTKSPESYFQTIFRCQNPDQRRKKEECHVFDLHPQRCLEMVYQYVEVTRRKEQSIQNAMRQFLDFAPILDHSGNKTVEVTVDTILNMITETGGYAESFGSTAIVNWVLLDPNSTIYDTVNEESNIKLLKQVSDNDLKKGKNYKSNTCQFFRTQKDKLKVLKEKVLTVNRSIPKFIYVMDGKIKSVNDLLTSKEHKVFKDIVQVTLPNFRHEIERGFINKDQLDRRIVAYNQLEKIL